MECCQNKNILKHKEMFVQIVLKYMDILDCVIFIITILMNNHILYNF